MSADEFCAWMKAVGLKGRQVADLFGISPNTVTKYRAEGAPRLVLWACKGYQQAFEAGELK